MEEEKPNLVDGVRLSALRVPSPETTGGVIIRDMLDGWNSVAAIVRRVPPDITMNRKSIFSTLCQLATGGYLERQHHSERGHRQAYRLTADGQGVRDHIRSVLSDGAARGETTKFNGTGQDVILAEMQEYALAVFRRSARDRVVMALQAAQTYAAIRTARKALRAQSNHQPIVSAPSSAPALKVA